MPGGVFDLAVEDGGHTLERWSVPDGASSDPARDYDAVMVFGGAMHPDQDDRFAWLAREEEFLHDALAERVPTVGVCLGAQLVARASGAAVRPAGEPEIGWLDVALTPAGAADPVLGVLLAAQPSSSGTTTPSTCPGSDRAARSPSARRRSGSTDRRGRSSSTPR